MSARVRVGRVARQASRVGRMVFMVSGDGGAERGERRVDVSEVRMRDWEVKCVERDWWAEASLLVHASAESHFAKVRGVRWRKRHTST